MDRPLAPEPGDGRYFFVGVLAVVVAILAVVVVNHPTIGPARKAESLLGLRPSPAAPLPAPAESTAP